ncbi:MAG: CapA family protein [Ruminococcaceae bacterium]|nr:CapA family protein [Oscillospiraceae bacterium]
MSVYIENMKLRILTLFILSLILAGLVYFAVVVSEVAPPDVSEENSNPATEEEIETGSNTQTAEGLIPGTTGETEDNPPDTAPSSTEEPPSTENEDGKGFRSVSFFAMGDNIVHDNVMRDASIKAGGTADDYSKGFDFSHMYTEIAPFVKNADLAFVNQETLICADETKKPVGYPDFNSPRAMGEQLISLGFDIVNTAHNHMLDMKTSGLINSIDYWRNQNGITLIGGYKTKDEFENITVVNKNGIRIAMLSYTDFVNYTHDNSSGNVFIPYAEKNVILDQVAKAKTLADCVIVSLHWGTEDQYYENNDQKNLAQALVDAGVDVIIGHHPHMLQTIKMKQRNDGGETLICYSLGNAVSTMLYIKYMLGAFVTFDITKDGAAPVKIENVQVTPTFNYYDKDYRNIKLYLLKNVTQDILDTHGSAINYGGNPVIADLEKRVNDHIPEALLAN